MKGKFEMIPKAWDSENRNLIVKKAIGEQLKIQPPLKHSFEWCWCRYNNLTGRYDVFYDTEIHHIYNKMNRVGKSDEWMSNLEADGWILNKEYIQRNLR